MIPIIVYIIVFALFMFDVNQHINAICESLFTKEGSHVDEHTTSSDYYNQNNDYNNLY